MATATVPEEGTTSACAENTFAVSPPPHTHGNYLRVRGEYLLEQLFERAEVELPPRARRILWTRKISIRMSGTTSACAENTRMRLQFRY